VIILLELAIASFALQRVFQLRGLVSYSYRMAQGIRRYQPPVHEDYTHAYPVEAFSTASQPQPCSSIDEESTRSDVEECPSLLVFTLLVMNPMQYFCDRIGSSY